MTDFFTYNEQELLNRVASGDTEAFRFIFDRYSKHTYALALRLTKSPELAEDMIQDIFTKLWISRTSLSTVQNFRPYLNTVIKNFVRDYLKRKVLTVENEPYLTEFFRESSPSPEDKLSFKELENVLNEAVSQLSPQLKQAFDLSRNEGLTHTEIAEKMNISVTTSKSHIVRALASIRKYIHVHYPHLELCILISLFSLFFEYDALPWFVLSSV